MRVVSVVGARPQFVKLAPIARAAAQMGIEHKIIHTGQHYDSGMSDVFFEGLTIPQPDVHLDVGSGKHGAQTAAMLAQLEPVLEELQPDWVLVYGDTNSTLAAAVATVKMHLPLAHLEAGLRSFNRRMPEEHNRVLTDHAADLLLAPSEKARAHLAAEGLADRAIVVGDVMVDVCYTVRDAVQERGVAQVQGEYDVSTIHRADNTDDADRLKAIVDVLADAPRPVHLVAHPRLRSRAEQFGIALDQGSIKLLDPLDYESMVRTVMGAHSVITDSGGLQKEAYLLGTACTTVRTETEWTETLHDGWNVLAAEPGELARQIRRGEPTGSRGTPYGDGNAASLALAALTSRR